LLLQNDSMKTRFIFAFLLLTVVYACKKDKYTTEPQIKFKSVTPGTAIVGDIISFRVEFTDKEGDIKDTVLIIYKRFNPDNSLLTVDTLKREPLTNNPAPDLTKGEIEITFAYARQVDGTQYIGPETAEDRKVAFGMILIDKAEHRSNYAESDMITLKKSP